MDLLNKRVVLVTGKGGVGRSTISAAMAIAAARQGKRVLLTEIGEPDGDYSPLARLFGRDVFDAKPKKVGRGVRACVLFSRIGHEQFLHSVLPVQTLVRAAMKSKALGRLLDLAPSFKEMGVFNYLLNLLKETRSDGSFEHELVIVDMPATGHTLALTSLPETLLKIIPVGPVAESLREGQAFLNNPQQGAACIVTLPEPLPVTECLELAEGLRASRMTVGGIFVNKIMRNPFTTEERNALKPLIQNHAVFGRSRFLAAYHNQRALERLHQNTSAPTTLIPEFLDSGDELIEHIANTLLAAADHP